MNTEDMKVVDAMKKFGGGFVNALAEAAMRADSDNLRRIKAGWPEYWDAHKQLATYEEQENDK